MTFPEVVAACVKDRDLLAEFDRLTGSNLSGRGTPIDLAIDQATGRVSTEAKRFLGFVFDAVWSRMPREDGP